ncbi:FecR domain-containing protein [Sphingomonas sp. OK281]|uniref:FecR family protein n=1 Tax=Sphingomonas sp. OK281 TaxID=1881067 RepID=UPI0008E0D24A|nr:FecR domain-containing protein [Sphingomonas sp. OK281]SFN66908.1 FecR family protein [Sphingomonas sp. OK281]
MNDNDVSGDGARAQAAHWYARLQTLPVSARTLEEFFAWRRLEGNRDAYIAVDRFYNQSGSLADRPAILAATEQAMNRPAHSSSNRGFSIGTLAAAALALVVVGVTLVTEWPAGGDRYATRIGEQRKLMLADGSRVMLDTDTAMTVKFVDGARRVSLEHGQAYFTVAHDAARPFTVDVGGARVLATGTQFDVHRNGDSVDVTLVEGSVRVSADDRPVARLRAGQALTLNGGRVSPIKVVDTTPATAWTRGRIVLDGMTLQDAIAAVNRYVDTPVRLDAAGFANARISGTVDTGDARSFAAAVTAVLPLTSQTDSDGSISLRQ